MQFACARWRMRTNLGKSREREPTLATEHANMRDPSHPETPLTKDVTRLFRPNQLK